MDVSKTQSRIFRAPTEVRFALVITAVMCLCGLAVFASMPVSLFDRTSTVVGFGLLLLSYLMFTSRHYLEWLRERTAKSRFLFPAMLLAVYVLYGLGPGRLTIPESLLIPAYLGFPILFATLAAKRGWRPNRFDLLTIAFLYLPVEMAALARAWRPAVPGIPSPSHPFTQLLAMNLALFCFMAIRPIEGIGFTLRLRARDFGQALLAFGWFFPLAVLFGTVTGFVPFRPHLPDPGLIIPVILGKTVMVALPEEVLFRGLMQNLLQRAASTVRGRCVAMLVTSVVFGCSHFNNHPTFDWRYVTIASVAGIAYGTVYNRTGKVTAAAITHALVDIVWKLFF